ncbi:CRP-like cAMP-binding protein [Rhodovulum iodosum]|uniref:CRP-like cAMP-binding protein n=1 Tax=Rhodovulum iodosum TaxID=68291 RepID=A0ABV3XUP0_9RHOB|nr:Crp/Fnr family transcriptional regulator [Rhodovulum robiginosum]RSK35104.1 Crp/Fnr family transcriptional regulator [Rhodovulum robiginosum]
MDAAPPPPSGPEWLSRLDGGVRRSHAPGAAISVPDAGENRIFVLEAGLARISLAGEARALTLGYLRPGGIFVTHTRGWVEALEPCEVQSWPVMAMLGLIAREPEMGVAAFREVGVLLHEALNLIEDLAFRPVDARLARFLLSERRIQGSDSIRLLGTTEALATALGTSRQTLSTLLNQMVREGVIARPDRQRVQILDCGTLVTRAALSSG